MTDRAVLVLEDGRTFDGQRYGAAGETVGEAVFATGMTGYQETLTDPSYRRQVVVMTTPHVGNTGVNDEDAESDRIWVAGYVVRDPARIPSSWRSRCSLDQELVAHGVVGIQGVDTRAVTRHLRERGAMRAGISSLSDDVDALLAKVRAAPPMTGADLTAEVSTPRPRTVPAVGRQRARVAVLDLGVKAASLRLLAQRGVAVHVLPAGAGSADVLRLGVDGVFCSNGPGDPAATGHAVALVRDLLRRGVPYFGICLGHQVLGLALGLQTYKLRFGHRGLNQPVLERRTGRVEVTAHNHGFAVAAPPSDPFPTPYGSVEVTHVCLNDGVVEGLAVTARDGGPLATSVQYHPEAAAGPHDSRHLFDRFVDLVAHRSGGR